MRITLKQIDVFTAVAREGSVTKAALWLHLTQSATSMALADLETQLGAKVFDRIGSGGFGIAAVRRSAGDTVARERGRVAEIRRDHHRRRGSESDG